MKKVIIIACLAGSSFIILDSMNAAHALFMFFLAGIIPGTSVVIDAARMLDVFALLFGFTLSRIAASGVHAALASRKTASHAAPVATA